MKVQYQFCTETVEIEVDEKWGAVVLDCDRMEYNNNQTQTRRHCSLEALNRGGDYLPDNDDVEAAVQFSSSLAEFGRALSDTQRELIQAIYVKGMSVSDYAKKTGVSQPAISQQLGTIKRKFKKIFS